MSAELARLRQMENADPELVELKKGEKRWGNILPSPAKNTIDSATAPPASAAPVLTFAEKMRQKRKNAMEEAQLRRDAELPDAINIAREENDREDLRRSEESYKRYLRTLTRRSPPRNERGRFYTRSPSRRPRSYSRSTSGRSYTRRSRSPRRRSPRRRSPRRRSSSRSPPRNERGRFYTRRRSPRRRTPSRSPPRNERGRFYSSRRYSRGRNERGRFSRSPPTRRR